jgi:hypothetical protein
MTHATAWAKEHPFLPSNLTWLKLVRTFPAVEALEGVAWVVEHGAVMVWPHIPMSAPMRSTDRAYRRRVERPDMRRAGGPR